ncbi:MAG: hypothetical protein GEU71_05245 [Actinobacteria bacterium]|nr:hypothetical protein [Actinomycetota bacterium]
MDELRRPFLIAAVVLMGIAVLLEVGAASILKRSPVEPGDLRRLTFQEANRSDDDDFDLDDAVDALPELEEMSRENRPPGRAIPYMALLDVILLYAVGMMALSLVAPERVQGRIQGIVGIIFSILLIIAAIILIIIAFVLLLIMIALLTSPPFGTIAYFAIFAFFNRTGATVVLSLIMLLKIGFVICLVLAAQRFLQNKSIVLLTLTSLIATIVISFLHGFVPLFLVSITDSIAALIVAILAVIWAIVMLIFSIVALVKLLF